MALIVAASLAACAGAVFSVLNQSVERNKRRNAAVSRALLILCAVLLAAALIYAVAAWLSR